jgi:hypothetical protein
MVDSAILKGQFLGPGGKPVEGAKVRIATVMIPSKRDLDYHIERREIKALGMFQGISYFESFSRPWLLPGLETVTTTDADGRFSFDKLPKDHIVNLRVTHPSVRTTEIRIAVRNMEAVYREPFGGRGEPSLSLMGSGFSCELPQGISLKGLVRRHWSVGVGPAAGAPIAGMTVAMANHNSATGMTGDQFTTDADGRFEITGLYETARTDAYTVAVVGSFDVPFTSRRMTIRPEFESTIEVFAAVPYRLKLTDEEGNPVDRSVYSMVVQSQPNAVHPGIKRHFNDPKRVAPGVYEGIVPLGPGVVVVKRGSKNDRPVSVNPKQLFSPSRSDWTVAETRYSYGDQWHIAVPRVISTSAGANSLIDQVDLAAVVFTDSKLRDSPLELSAVIVSDRSSEVNLVDEAGEPVTGANIHRQLKKYNGKELPAKIEVYGLHPDRAEYLHFVQEERGLIGYLKAKLSDKPQTVVLYRAAILTGRFVDKTGEPSRDFGMVMDGTVPPDTMVANNMFGDKAKWGRFELGVVPGSEYSGRFARKTHQWRIRPTIGLALKPVTPKPGETIDLGDIVVP